MFSIVEIVGDSSLSSPQRRVAIARRSAPASTLELTEMGNAGFYEEWRTDGTYGVSDRDEWHLPVRNGARKRAGRSLLPRLSGHLVYMAAADGGGCCIRLSSDCSGYARIRAQLSAIRLRFVHTAANCGRSGRTPQCAGYFKRRARRSRLGCNPCVECRHDAPRPLQGGVLPERALLSAWRCQHLRAYAKHWA